MKRYIVPITVIMPCYNSESFVAKAIESILSQSFPSFEFIIINDGSTDRSKEIIEQFDDPRIKLIDLPVNKGNFHARNMGLKNANGKYICTMDSDDISMPDRLKIQYNYLETHKKIGGIGAMGLVIDKQDTLLSKFKHPLSHSSIKILSLRNSCVIHSSLMIRSWLLKKHRLQYDTKLRYAADYDFLCRCLKYFKIENLAQTLVRYRLHHDQISSKNKQEQRKIADSIRIKQLKSFNIPLDNDVKLLHLQLMRGGYVSESDMEKAIAWFNRLLTQNQKFNLYHDRKLYAFLKHTLALAARRQQLGGWAIEHEVIEFIKQKSSDRSTFSILEFGSGIGTEALLQHFQVVSIEHNVAFISDNYKNHTFVYAPLTNNWYDLKKVNEALAGEFDLILIDGPPDRLRGNILDNIHIFKETCSPVIFDDMQRPYDKEVMKKFCQELGYSYVIHQGEKKQFAYCEKVLKHN